MNNLMFQNMPFNRWQNMPGLNFSLILLSEWFWTCVTPIQERELLECLSVNRVSVVVPGLENSQITCLSELRSL